MSLGLALALTAAVPAASAPAVQGVASYPASFFAPSQPNTALDMLAKLPGFTFDAGATVRGFGGAAGNVLVDGERPASKGDGLDEILRRIPASSVLRIDVIRGGAPGIDMQGKTVLANVIKRQETGPKLTIAAAGQRAYDARLGGGLRLEGSDQVGPTSYEASLFLGKGFDDGTGDGSRVERDASGAVILNAAEKGDGDALTYKATGAVETPVLGGKLRIDSNLTLSPYDSLVDDRVAIAADDQIEHFHQEQATGEIGLRYDHAIGPAASIETYLLQQLGKFRSFDDFFAPGADADFNLRKDGGESIARTTLKYAPARSLALEGGLEGDFNWVQTHTTYVQAGVPILLPAADVRVTEARGEAFGAATWRARPTLTLEAGLRLEASTIASTGDVVQSKTLIYPKPRAVVTWSPDGSDQVRVRLEREVDQLNFDDFAASAASLSTGTVHAGNPNLIPGQDWVIEAAYDRRFWGAGDATVTLRHYRLSDVIDRVPVYDPAGAFDAPGNIGGGSKDEVAVALTLPTDKVSVSNGVLSGNWTWRWSRVRDPTTGEFRPISGLRHIDAEAHFIQGLPRWKSTWGVDVYHEWREVYYRFDEIDNNRLKTYVTLFAEYKPHPDLSFRVELDNATARGFKLEREVYNGPRNISGLDYTDVRDLEFGRLLYFRIRKTFG
ncbi:MAG TPA: TonB-dependent receptor plug domain-containing protein [Caulobacteraceae bacterium]